MSTTHVVSSPRVGVRRLVATASVVALAACSGSPASPVPDAVPTVTSTPDVSSPSAAVPTALAWDVVAEGFAAPVLALPRPDTQDVWVAEQRGRIVTLDGALVVDLEDRVAFRGERGLLGLAFAPDHAGTGRFFLHYSRAEDGATRVEAWTAAADGTVRPDHIVLEVPQPAANHNGGMIAFGPDGMLYVALGDGGAADDRFGNGQRADTLLGTILRLDVSTAPYAVPQDNPFVDGRTATGEPAAPEVWAYGLRNPWRFWIDEPSGQVVVADVGQNRIEEIDALLLSEGGRNLGWPLMEGSDCFAQRDCTGEGLVAPIAEYDHADGCSVTGGVVVRGGGLPELDGHFLYSDFCTGFLRSVIVDGPDRGTTFDWTDQVGVPGQVLSFGLDADGAPLVLTADGTIRRLVAG